MRIDFWRPQHAPQLTEMLRAFLAAGEARGGDVVADDHNVEWYLDLGMDAAGRGEPCLVALEDEEPVAFVLWLGINSALHCKWKTLHAWGSYTSPTNRSRGIASELRERALVIGRELGFERVLGPVHALNSKGMHVFGDRGAKVESLVYAFPITAE